MSDITAIHFFVLRITDLIFQFIFTIKIFTLKKYNSFLDLHLTFNPFKLHPLHQTAFALFKAAMKNIRQLCIPTNKSREK